MCGQYYYLKKVRLENEIEEYKKITIKPGEETKVMIYQNNQYTWILAKWGLKSQYGQIINARAETVLEKRLFKNLSHCLIVAKGYYEWDFAGIKTDISSFNKEKIYMAGLYMKNQDHYQYVVLTTKANDSISSIHDRMPLILNREEAILWLKNIYTSEILRKIPDAMQIQQAHKQVSLF